MKKNGLVKIIIAVFICVAIACALIACKPDPYTEREIPNLNQNIYMQVDRERLNFMLGMTVDTKDIISKCGAKIVDDEGNEANVADYLDDGTVTYEEFDLSTVGKDKSITLSYKELHQTIMYDVTDFTLNLYLDEEKTELWKSVKPDAQLGDDLRLAVYVNMTDYNYSIDSKARANDESLANRFRGWRDAVGNTITGYYSIGLSPSGGERVIDLHAHFLTFEERADMKLSYDINGDRIFSGYTGEPIETLRIPEGVTKIDLVSTFKSGFNFTKVRIPSTARMDLALIAGINTDGLTEITVDSGNQAYASYGGALYSKDYTRLYLMPSSCLDGVFHSSLSMFETWSCAYWQMDAFVIPESVMTVKEYAFANSSLTAVGGMNRCNIYQNAFFGSKMKVKEHVIDNKLVALYNSQTDDLEAGPYVLTMIVDKNMLSYTVIPNTVELAAGVFRDCESLAIVDLGTSLVKIGSSAFSGCTSLRRIELPVSLKQMGSAVFYGCSALSEVTGLGDITALESTVETEHKIPSDLFYGCNALTTVSFARGNNAYIDHNTLADGIKEIGDSAFYKCTMLPECTLPTTIEKIGNSAFRDCARIKQVKFPESLKSIGQSAFYNSGLTTIDLSTCPKVTTLQSSTFRATKLTKVTIPEWIKSIPSYCFYGITTLLTLEMGNITSVASYGFGGCTSLNNVTWSENLTSIGEAAFYNDTGLPSIQLSNVTSIGKNAFRGCSSLTILTKADLGDKLKTIASQAFMSCTNLEEVDLPDSVVTVEQSVFSSCNKLKKVTLGASVKSFGTYSAMDADGVTFGGTAVPAVYHAANLEQIRVSPANENFIDYDGVLFGREIGGKEYPNFASVLYFVPPKFTKETITVPETSYALPTYVRVIAPYAFVQQSVIKTLVLNEGLENIGKAAFYEATSIDEIKLPSTIKHVDSGILLQSSITNVTIADGNSVLTSDGNMIYSKGQDGDTETDVVLYIGQSREAVIKDGVKHINGGLFMRDTTVTSVVIPDSVETVGKRAFYQCSNITSITIGKGLKDLGDEGFWQLPKLATITISEDNPYMKAVNNVIYSKDGTKLLYAAQANGMTSLSEIEDGVVEICKQAFEGHVTLTDATLPASVQIIGEKAFFDCEKLAKIVATSNLKSIGTYAFSFTNKSSSDYRWCNALKSVLLYGGVTIGDNAFTGQYGIESLYLKLSVDEVSEFHRSSWTNKIYLVSGCPDNANNAYYNNGGRGVDKYIYCYEEPTVFYDGYGWFYFDENGNPKIWG